MSDDTLYKLAISPLSSPDPASLPGYSPYHYYKRLSPMEKATRLLTEHVKDYTVAEVAELYSLIRVV